jgi:hypothetical protein
MSIRSLRCFVIRHFHFVMAVIGLSISEFLCEFS